MCGICGIYNYSDPAPVDRQELKKMNDLLIHRGPDDEGYHLAGNIGLAMRRLSIIDLSTGHQPMCNEDGTVWLVFNGEIYNFQELRETLLAKGHVFRTKSDTETIVHLYEEKGADFPKELRGMFAIAIWDSKKRTLLLARDRLGKKPLYYYRDSRRFLFASEIKAILSQPGVERRPDKKAIHHFLSYNYIPAPITAFENIRKLPQASVLELNDLGLSVKPYWRLEFRQNRNISFSDAKDEIKRLVTESVKLRMIADVPLGAFLSGGIDSSIVVGVMSSLSSRPVKTFCIGFDEKDYDETLFAEAAAKKFGTEHLTLTVKPDAMETLPKLIWYYDQPFGDASALPSYYLARETRKHVTVALNGDGGDENFAGYGHYKDHMFAHYYYYQKLPGFLRKEIMPGIMKALGAGRNSDLMRRAKGFVESCALSPQERDIRLLTRYSKKELAAMYTPEFAASTADSDLDLYLAQKHAEAGTRDLLSQLLYADIMTYLPEDLMTKMDIASMANSLETRSPLLDHKLVEFAATLPSEFKLNKALQTKYILKEAFKDILPREIYERGKKGFGVPVGRWFRNELKDYLKDILLSGKFEKRNILKKEAVLNLVTEHIEGRRDNSERLWALVNLELWFRTFIDGFGV